MVSDISGDKYIILGKPESETEIEVSKCSVFSVPFEDFPLKESSDAAFTIFPKCNAGGPYV